ncbi:MAG: silent information regulator protein Sir2, partial [bacterium]
HAYLGDIDPDRPGLEIYYGIESPRPDGNGMCLVDAKSGEIIWGIDFPTHHVHSQGLCSDIDRVHPGRECYSGEISPAEGKRTDFVVMHSSKGEIIDREIIGGLSPLAVYWDTDNQRELLVDGKIYDYRGPTVHHENVEGKVIAVADIFGDWREEIITSVPGELRIYTSTIYSNSRYTCLMQDPIYRNNVAHGSMGYTLVPMTTYDLPFK